MFANLWCACPWSYDTMPRQPAVRSRCRTELCRTLLRFFVPHDFRTGSTRTQGYIISGPDQWAKPAGQASGAQIRGGQARRGLPGRGVFAAVMGIIHFAQPGVGDFIIKAVAVFACLFGLILGIICAVQSNIIR